MKRIASAFFHGASDLDALLQKRLTDCRLYNPFDDFVVVTFAGKPTDSGEPIVVSVLMDVQNKTQLSVNNLPGVSRLNWVFLVDAPQMDEPPVLQLATTAVENPVVQEIGGLSKAILERLPLPVTRNATAPETAEAPVELRPFAYHRELPLLKRSTFVISVNAVFYPGAKQVSGEATFNNRPRQFVTINAGVGIIVGPMKGAQRMKVDGLRYAADPLPRFSTMAGATWHVPFDASTISPSWKERVGLATFAVLQPAGGFAAGPTFGWRGFAVSIMKAFMWVNSTPDGQVPGADAPTGVQLQLKRADGFVLGGTYAF